MSGTHTEGVPSQRATYSFELIPTDLNRDGRIDGTLVNGIAENTARYNNTFLPRNYTSATAASRYEQDNVFYIRSRAGTNNPRQIVFSARWEQ